MKNVRSSQPCISINFCTEFSKAQNFPCIVKWLKNVDKFDMNSISEKSPIGYILKVDLE